MKIAFLLDRFPQNGGVESITIVLCNKLIQLGDSIVIISQKGDKIDLLQSLDSNIKYIGLDKCSYKSSCISEILHKEKVEVLINQGAYPQTNLLLCQLKQQSHIPVISVLHNEPSYVYKSARYSINGDGWKPLLKRRFSIIYLYLVRRRIKANYRRLLKFSEYIVLLSPKYVDDFIEWHGAVSADETGKLLTIPNAISCASEKSHLKKRKSILFVGRLEESQKRLSRLLGIWEKISKKYTDWELDIVGDGPNRTDYENYVRSKSIERVNFHGYHKDVASFYSSASILALTSEYEGFPMVLLEAMSSGCVPVLFNSFSAASEIIQSKINGVLVNPFDNNEFTHQLEYLINNPNELDRMALSAEGVAQRYSLDSIIIKWQEVILTSLNCNKCKFLMSD